MLFEHRLVIFYWKYILAREDNCNFVENNYQTTSLKSIQNPLITTEVRTEKVKRSMFNIARNLFDELAWELWTCLTGSFVTCPQEQDGL